MNRVVIAVGSNINPHHHIEQTRQKLSDAHILLDVSQFVRTKPIGYAEQADFVNGAFLIQTSLGPAELKQWLRELEHSLGRVGTVNKSGPRTIDLDIAVWNGTIVDSDIHTRKFMKNAVLELCPELTGSL